MVKGHAAYGGEHVTMGVLSKLKIQPGGAALPSQDRLQYPHALPTSTAPPPPNLAGLIEGDG